MVIVSLVAVSASVQAKQQRTFYDEQTVTRVRERVRSRADAKAQADAVISSCAWLLEMPEQQLWDLVPPPEQLRAINVCHGVGCPFCGEEIIRKAGHYPWNMDRDRPFKVSCPVCEREFPENSFEPWNTAGKDGVPESGERIIDKGVGWLDADGNRYYFVAYYMFWQRWCRDILGGVRSLGEAYVLTDDPIYARKCAVLLARIAGQYERFDYRTQCYHEGIWNVNGRISDYIWTTGNNSTLAMAYDAVFPALAADQDLQRFLRDKGIQNIPDHIERKMLNVMVGDLLSGYARGNMGAHQTSMCKLAIVLDNSDPARGHTTREMVDWLMAGEGRIEDLLWNGFWRDGLGGESSPGYSSGWCSTFYGLAELLPKLGVEIWQNPKLRTMADVGLQMTVAGRFCPCIGDSGGVKGSGPIAWSAALQGRAFTRYGDLRYAKALKLMKASPGTLWEDYFDENAVSAALRDVGPDLDLALHTRNIGGYGLAILESGTGEHRRGATMYYGDATGGHGHRDRLTIGLFAYGHDMLPEMGYPTPFRTPKRFGWTSNTISHYCVLIDRQPQSSMIAGDLNTLASTPGVQLMDASAETAYPGAASLYRRTTALIDVDEQNSYLLDIFRVRGGGQHDWSFHGPAGFAEFSATGGVPGPRQENGTLAGESVPYGRNPPPVVAGGGHLVDLKRAQGLLTGGSYGELSSRGWAVHGNGVLTRKSGTSVTLRLEPVPAGTTTLFMYVWDYNNGSNEIGVSLGTVAKTIRFEASGTVGYRWIRETVTLSEPCERITISAERVGQSWITIDRLVLRSGTDVSEPQITFLGGSGFEYLYNIQRMRPETAWSATWRKPDEDLALTLRVPAGFCSEVIIGDGEPELQPGNPKTIRYVLGRNRLPERARPGAALASTFAALVEPHRGPASLTSVHHLRGPGTSAGALGLRVLRGAVTDLVHSSPASDLHCSWLGAEQPFTVAAEFALLSVDAKGVRRAVLVNGDLLSYGEFRLRPERLPAARVVALHFAENAVTIDVPLPLPAAHRSTVAVFRNELQSTSYTVNEASVDGGRTRLQFGNVLYVVGMGRVAGLDREAGTITSDRPLAGYGRVDGGRHAGRWLFNEDRTVGFRIRAVAGREFTLEAPAGDLQQAFAATGRRYWISDIGPGDRCTIPAVSYYAR